MKISQYVLVVAIKQTSNHQPFSSKSTYISNLSYKNFLFCCFEKFI